MDESPQDIIKWLYERKVIITFRARDQLNEDVPESTIRIVICSVQVSKLCFYGVS
jgi:hypothetical protein